MEKRLQELVAESHNTVFFGGAGMSTESGIPDFRSQDGLYNQSDRYPPETILSHSFFMKKPEEFYRFYREKMIYDNARPNRAHLGLARLEQQGKLQAIITQNIDGLHQAAGSQRVLELHGSVHRNYCMRCKKEHPLSALSQTEGVPTCSCGGVIRPDVVLYEEGLEERVMEQAVQCIRQAQLLIVGGTSLAVYPAAGLLQYFKGSTLVLINKTKTLFDERATLIYRESLGEILG